MLSKELKSDRFNVFRILRTYKIQNDEITAISVEDKSVAPTGNINSSMSCSSSIPFFLGLSPIKYKPILAVAASKEGVTTHAYFANETPSIVASYFKSQMQDFHKL